MTEAEDRHNRVTRWVRWVARIWSIPIIVYALIMAAGYAWSWLTTGVADPYAVEDYPPIENLPPIFLFLSIVGLGIAWRWEQLGAVIALVFQAAAVVALLLHLPITRDFPRSALPYILVLVAAVPGVLFLVCSRRSRAGVAGDSAQQAGRPKAS